MDTKKIINRIPAVLEGTSIHRCIKDYSINANGLKASSEGNKTCGNLLRSTCANPFSEFLSFLSKKTNRSSSDDFTTWKRASGKNVAYRPRTGWRVAKMLFFLWIQGRHWRASFKEDRGDHFDMSAEERRKQKGNTRVVWTGVEQAGKSKSRLFWDAWQQTLEH